MSKVQRDQHNRSCGNSNHLDFDTLAHLAGSRHGEIDVVCPVCAPQRRTASGRRKKTLHIWRTKPDFITFNCARCPDTKGYAHRAGRTGPHIDRQELERQQAEAEAAARDRAAQQTARALALWSQAGPIVGTLAATYLAARGILGAALPFDVTNLRFDPTHPIYGERHPALLALMRDVLTDEPRGIRRIALFPNATKNRDFCGSLGPKASAGVKFAARGDHLVVGEGVETIVAAMTLGLGPCWALGDARELAAVPVLDGVAALAILVDHDASGTGQNAARACSARWTAAGRKVARLIPFRTGEDINDLVQTKEETL